MCHLQMISGWSILATIENPIGHPSAYLRTVGDRSHQVLHSPQTGHFAGVGMSEVNETSRDDIGHRNMFLEGTTNQKNILMSGGSEKNGLGYSPSLALDLRLEIDRLQSANRDQAEEIERLTRFLEKSRMHCLIWKIEGSRLNAVNEDLTERCRALHGYVEEATRQAGKPSDKEAELERQLESLLSTNQKNLEALKFKKMSLDKCRKKYETLQAENVLLKMALEATTLATMDDVPNSSGDRDWRQEYQQLRSRYDELEDQYHRQENFANELNDKVSKMMAAQVSECNSLKLDLDEAHQEISRLKDLVAELRAPQVTLPGSNLDLEEVTIARRFTMVSAESPDYNPNLAAQAAEAVPVHRAVRELFEELLRALRQALDEVPEDSCLRYHAEMIQVKSLSVSKGLPELEDAIRHETLGSTLHGVVPPTQHGSIPCKMQISNDIEALGLTFKALIQETKLAAKPLPESPIRKGASSPQLGVKGETFGISPVSNHSQQLEVLQRENNELRRLVDTLQAKPQSSHHTRSEGLKGSTELDFGSLYGSNNKRGGLHSTVDSAAPGHSSKVETLQEELTISQKRCRELSGLVESLKWQVNDLEASKVALREQISSMSSELSAAKHQHLSQQSVGRQVGEVRDELLEKLSREADEVRSRLQETESILRDKIHQLKKAETDLKTLRDQADAKHTALEQMEQAFEDLKRTLLSDLETAKAECRQLQAEKEDVAAELDSVKRELDEVGSEQDHFRDENRLLKVRLEKVSQEGLSKESDLERTKDEIRRAREEIEKRIALRESENASLKHQLSEQTSELASLEKELKRTQSLYDDLVKRASGYESTIEELEKACRELERAYQDSQRKGSTGRKDHRMKARRSSNEAELEDMRDFVQSMKQEHQYISGNHSEALMNAEAVIMELKHRNKELMDQLIQAEQQQAMSALQMANSREREGLREKNSALETEIQRLRREMDDVEKTCKHMRDRFDQEQEASQYTSRDLQDKISQLEREKQHYMSKSDQLQKVLDKKDGQLQELQLGSEKLKRKVLELQSSVSTAGHRGLAQLVPFLTQLRSQVRHIGHEVDTARGIQVDLQRLFVSRMSSLKTLFRSEAEIAPRGTILQMMKLRDSQVSSMTAAEKVRRELKEDFSQRHRKIEEEFSDRLRRECYQRDQRIDEAEGVIEELRKELREGMHREKILRREAEETAQEHKKLVSSNDALAKSLERLASQKSSDDESIKNLNLKLHQIESKIGPLSQQNKELQIQMEELLKQREDATQEIASLTVRLSDSEDQITELSAQLEVTTRELKQRKLQLKEVSSNKENLKSSDNTLIFKMKELQSNVETLSDKLRDKMRENHQLKQQIALGSPDVNSGGETQKRSSKSPMNTQLLNNETSSTTNDRVGIIRSKLSLLFAKMAKALVQMQESDDFLKEKNAALLGGTAGYRSKYSEQVLGFREDLMVLQNDYEQLGKQYVNDAIDICQKTLKVYESMQTLNQKLRAKAQERS